LMLLDPRQSKTMVLRPILAYFADTSAHFC
jgi:hypothetical protein